MIYFRNPLKREGIFVIMYRFVMPEVGGEPDGKAKI